MTKIPEDIPNFAPSCLPTDAEILLFGIKIKKIQIFSCNSVKILLSYTAALQERRLSA